MNEKHYSVYLRRDDGTLARTTAMLLDGDIYIGGSSYPVMLTRTGSTSLRGWGKDDGGAVVFATEAGREIIWPIAHALPPAAAE